MNIIKEQMDDIKLLKDNSNSPQSDFDLNDYGYGYEGDKKTILKPAQKNTAKFAYSAQSCLFQIIQQIDTFRDQIAATQKRKDQPSLQEMFGIMGAFLSGTKTIRSRDEFRELLGPKV